MEQTEETITGTLEETVTESGMELLLSLRKQIQGLKATISQKDSEIELHKGRIVEMETAIKEIISLAEN